MRQTDTDVCVVGGGPAGLTMALLLARSGLDVVVLERATSFEREYRGEILQPGAQRVLDQLGVLGPLRARGGYPMRRFQLVEHDRALLDIDYARLPAPFDHLLSVPQRLLLEELHAACVATPGFHQLDGVSCRELRRRDGVVTGVRHGDGDREEVIRSRWVVGADGRHSRVRRLAGLPYQRFEAFEHDVVWFKLAADGPPTGVVRIHRGGGNPVLLHDSWPGRLQVGWTLPHGGYREIAARGFGHVQERLTAAVPALAGPIREQVTALNQLSPLDVFSGRATGWATDGLVLIGDSAHTHSPIGAQGINLAIQDAAELHPALVAAVRTGDTGRSAVAAYERSRGAAADAAFRLQTRQSVGMLSGNPVVGAVRPLVAAVLPRTPLYRKILRLVAFGAHPVEVRTDLFRADLFRADPFRADPSSPPRATPGPAPGRSSSDTRPDGGRDG